jgi:hypothetical protein
MGLCLPSSSFVDKMPLWSRPWPRRCSCHITTPDLLYGRQREISINPQTLISLLSLAPPHALPPPPFSSVSESDSPTSGNLKGRGSHHHRFSKKIFFKSLNVNIQQKLHRLDSLPLFNATHIRSLENYKYPHVNKGVSFTHI